MSASPRAPDHVLVGDFTRRSQSNFYYSFLFLPTGQRRAIEAVYAFCRSIDDAVDGAASPEAARAELAWWRRELAACFGEGAPSHAITRDLASQVKRFDLTREPLEEVIRGVEMDLTRNRYATFEELALYCRRVASAVGHSCIEIFGSRGDDARRYATTLGLAFQMTNIIRDFRADARRGRIYTPRDEMDRFGYSEEEALAGLPGVRFVNLMQFQCGRARDLFEQASSQMPRGERAKLMAAEIMGATYRRLLEKIARRPEAVLEGRVALSRPRRMVVAAAAFARARLRA